MSLSPVPLCAMADHKPKSLADNNYRPLIIGAVVINKWVPQSPFRSWPLMALPNSVLPILLDWSLISKKNRDSWRKKIKTCSLQVKNIITVGFDHTWRSKLCKVPNLEMMWNYSVRVPTVMSDWWAMAGVPQTSSHHQSVLPHHQHQHHHSVASDTQSQGQCIYNDPSVLVKTEYDQGKDWPLHGLVGWSIE